MGRARVLVCFNWLSFPSRTEVGRARARARARILVCFNWLSFPNTLLTPAIYQVG